MGGIFGVISTEPCINDLFYGTDYNSHLGTKRAGMATYSKEQGFVRAIHNIESSYFRNKFEDELDEFQGTSGIGVISDNDSQPIIVYSHLGRYGGQDRQSERTRTRVVVGRRTLFGTKFLGNQSHRSNCPAHQPRKNIC